jgi:hypothetical protein
MKASCYETQDSKTRSHKNVTAVCALAGRTVFENGTPPGFVFRIAFASKFCAIEGQQNAPLVV